jgi:hypothetical protein
MGRLGKYLFPVILAAATAAYGQSLQDVARKERARREKIDAAKSITNSDTAKYKDSAITTLNVPSSADSVKKDGSESATQAKSGPSANESAAGKDEPVDLEGRPESFWRQAFGDARKNVKELENGATALTLKLNDLQNQFYREANGFKQQELQREIQKTFYEQDKNKQELAKAKDQLQDLEKEARKSGALPGWITPRP